MNDVQIEQIQTEKLILDKLRFTLCASVPNLVLLDPEVEVVRDIADQMAYYLRYVLLGNKMPPRTETAKVYYPDGPWEMWKWKYAPKWFVDRWPVRNREIVAVTNVYQYNVCPHLDVPYHEDKNRHYLFLQRGLQRGTTP